MVLAMSPPSSGPSAPAVPHTAPMTPCTEPRSCISHRSPTIVIVTGWIAPAPAPWMIRPITSISSVPA